MAYSIRDYQFEVTWYDGSPNRWFKYDYIKDNIALERYFELHPDLKMKEELTKDLPWRDTSRESSS